MGVFNFASFGKAPSASPYSHFTDSLSIAENQLKGDGNLSPGDNKYLADMARKVRNSPGLTPDQRSSLDVKISGYESGAKSKSISDANDLGKISRDYQDSISEVAAYHANDPATFIAGKGLALQNKISALYTAMNNMATSGADATQATLDYTSAVQDMQDLQDAAQIVQSGKGADSRYSAYVTTDDQGNIIGMDISKDASRAGYAQTNATYGGFKVQGNVRKDNTGGSSFLLAGKRFTGNSVIYNPDGTTSSGILTDLGYGKSGTTVIDPSQVTLNTGASVHPGTLLKGQNGIYKKNPDGSFTKYVGFDQGNPQFADKQIQTIPSSLEQSVNNQVSDTQAPFGPLPAPPTGSIPAPINGPVEGPQLPTQGPQSIAPTGSPTPPAGRARTPQPTPAAPASASGTAAQTQQSAGGFLQGIRNLFE